MVYNPSDKNPTLCVNRPMEMIANFKEFALYYAKKGELCIVGLACIVYLVQNAQQIPLSKKAMENQSVSLAPFQVLQVHSREYTNQLEHRLLW